MNMSDSKTYVFPEGLSGNNGFDVATLMALANNNNGFGGNGNMMWIFFLFFLWPLLGGNNLFGNGMNGNGFVSNQLNNETGRELLMQAINGNGNAINQLATMFNTKSDNITAALNNVNQQICNMNSDIRLDTCQQTNAIQNTMNTNTQSLKDANTIGFASVINKLESMETNALRDKIDALQEKNQTLNTQLNLEHQNLYTALTINSAVAPLQAGINSLNAEVDALKCKFPDTVTLPYSNVTAVPNWAAYGMGWNNGWGGFWGNNGWGTNSFWN